MDELKQISANVKVCNGCSNYNDKVSKYAAQCTAQSPLLNNLSRSPINFFTRGAPLEQMKVAALVPGIDCCVLIVQEIILSLQNSLSLICNRCCHLTCVFIGWSFLDLTRYEKTQPLEFRSKNDKTKSLNFFQPQKTPIFRGKVFVSKTFFRKKAKFKFELF